MMVVAACGSGSSGAGGLPRPDGEGADGAAPSSADASPGDGGPAALRWDEMPAALGDVEAVGAYLDTVWAVFGSGSQNDASYRGTLARLDASGAWNVVVPSTPGPMLKRGSSSATLQGVGPRAVVYANSYRATLVVEGQSPQELGASSQGTGTLNRLDARAADDVWISSPGATGYHLVRDKVTGYCIESDIPGHCGGGFTPGIFYDGKKLWLAASADASGQSRGIYSVEPGAAAGFLPGKLALSGDYDIMARGPGGTAWAMGMGGTGAHFDGTSWATSATGITIDQGIAGAVVQDDGQVWVCGYEAIVHFDGKSWAKVTESGTPDGGSSIAVTHDGTVYVVKDGHLYRRRAT